MPLVKRTREMYQEAKARMWRGTRGFAGCHKTWQEDRKPFEGSEQRNDIRVCVLETQLVSSGCLMSKILINTGIWIFLGGISSWLQTMSIPQSSTVLLQWLEFFLTQSLSFLCRSLTYFFLLAFALLFLDCGWSTVTLFPTLYPVY